MRPRQIELVNGATSRDNVVEIDLSDDVVRARLSELLATEAGRTRAAGWSWEVNQILRPSRSHVVSGLRAQSPSSTTRSS